MRRSGAAATCLPVQIEADDWEAALFIHVAGPECKRDRQALRKSATPTPTRLEAELLTHGKASVAVLRLQILTAAEDPLSYEILLTPGAVQSHYESLKLLAGQARLCWFFGDSDYRLLRAQQQELSDAERGNFENMARQSFAHDSVVRMAGKYDAEAALAEIVSHYQLREGVAGHQPAH